MQTQARRVLHDGSAYDGLFPRATGGEIVVKQGAGLEDTLRTIRRVVGEYGWQAAGIARVLRGRDSRETSRNLWDFLYRHVQYRQDEKDREQVRTPARVWHDRHSGVDCDCYATFISCVLTNLGIRHTLRVTKYPDLEYGEPDPPFSHIYVVVLAGNRQTIIDPVTDSFDYEVPYLAKKDITMDLEILNGIPPDGGYSPSSVDFDDIMAGGLGAVDAGTSMITGREAQAAAAKGMTIEQYREWSRQEFIRQTGMTPEQATSQAAIRVAASQQNSTQVAAQEMAQMKAELDRRKVKYPANATREQLMELLKSGVGQGGVSKAANVVNRFNPATAAVRTGILIAMKVNYLGIARKVRYGYMTQGQAGAAGITPQNWQKSREVLTKLEKVHHTAGGDINHLRKAILEGKGNRDRRVGLSGLGCARPVSGLGEPVTAAVALTAATTVLAAVAAAVKQVQDGKAETAEEKAVNPAEAEAALRELPAETAGEGGAEPAYQGTETPVDYLALPDTPLPPDAREAKEPPADDPPKKGIVQWVKDNPVLAGAIGVAATAGAYLGFRALTKPQVKQAAKPGGPLNGPPKGKARPKGKGGTKGKVRTVKVP